MTMPSERTRAVVQTREFLIELSANPKIPEKARYEALQLLRHYPTGYEMNEAARLEVASPELLVECVFR